MNKRKLRLVSIDDNTDFRNYLCEVLNTDSMIEVVGNSGIRQGRKLLAEQTPDIITIEPGSIGTAEFKAAAELVSEAKVPVVVISAIPESRQELMKAGAWDFVDKADTLSASLSAQFEYLVKLRIKTQAATPAQAIHSTEKEKPPGVIDNNRETVILMGASLGGTEVIYQILQQLPNTLPGIVIVQHMPPNFTNAYAIRLNAGSNIEVREARDGDEVLRGTALVAPGGRQLTIRPHGNGYSVKLGESEKYGGFCPSVDVLFQSACFAGKNAVGVILTGMGRDGAEGITLMHKSGAYTIGQSRESCAVFGMPAAAQALGGIDDMLSIEGIIGKLSKL